MRKSRLIAGRSHRECLQRIVLLLAVLCSLAARPTTGHEFWIEPRQFRPAPGAKVPITLYVGQYFMGNSYPFLSDSFERFYYVDARGTENIRSVLGDDPAATLTIRAPGRIWIVLRSAYFDLSYDKPGEFDAFLAREGIDHLVPRERRGPLPVKETYSRSAKSLLVAGDPPSGSAPDRAFGLPLELVAESDPYAGRPAEFRVRLLFRGSALPGALVTAFHKAVPDRRLEARTDASGRARLALDRDGVWLLNAVHLLPAQKKGGALWETLWASLTFELPRRRE
jgi:uncharacterized GH25 family protein